MKKISLLAIVACLSLYTFTSCSDDDGNPTQDLANEQNNAEDEPIDVNLLENGFTLSGGTSTTGTPPTPSVDLDFTVNRDLTEAFQNTEFNSEFQSGADVAGVYIQFKDVNGTAAQNYYDVPATTFSRNQRRLDSSKKKNLTARVLQRSIINDFENTVEINISNTVPAGEFCYDICPYDSEGNVGQIETVCVTIESWGGNASIVGEWMFDRSEPDEIDEDDTTTINCENGEEFTAPYTINSTNNWTFVLNSDGSYYEEYDNKSDDLDFQASSENCEAVYVEDVNNDRYSGFWAYNEDTASLTVVDFAYEDFLNASDNEEYTEGEVYFEGVTAEIISGQLVLTDTDGDETIKVYFNKK